LRMTQIQEQLNQMLQQSSGAQQGATGSGSPTS
jgi:hypothetical protein